MNSSMIVVLLLNLLCHLREVSADQRESEDPELCPSGTEGARYGNLCVPCQIGYFRTQGVQSSCTQCPEGFITLEAGAGLVTNCDVPIGMKNYCPSGYEWMDETSSCIICPQGRYRTQYVDYWCVRCPKDTDTVGTGAVSIHQCVSDECPFGSAWSSDTNWCERCPQGYYRGEYDMDTCVPCPLNFTTLFTGSTDVTDCVAGLSNGGNIFMEDECPSGTEYNALRSTCVVCPVNWYRHSLVTSVCQPCPDETYTLAPGAVDELLCLTMQELLDAQQVVGGPTVLECPLGTEWNAADESCTLCPIGTYRDDLRSPLCQLCTDSRITQSAGTINPDLCGYEFNTPEQPVDGVFDPKQCPPGTSWDSSACLPCPVGYYSVESETCQKCPPATTTLSTGSSSPDYCLVQVVPGVDHTYFQEDMCPLGTEWDSGMQGCRACPLGFYRDETHPECQSCPADFTTLTAGSQDEGRCNVPFTAPLFLPIASEGCPDGYESSQNSSYCFACPPGYYKPGTNWESCLHCPGMKDTMLNGIFAASSPSQCPPIFSIEMISPLVGPQSGGTEVMIHVTADASVRFLNVTVGAESICVLQSHYAADGVLRCVTSPVRSIGPPNPLIIYSTLGVSHTSSQEFEYKLDPVITSISRSSAYQSGGTSIIIYGENLDSITTPKLTLTPSPKTSTSVPVIVTCIITSSTIMTCPLEAFPKAEERRRRRRNSPESAAYTPGLQLDGLNIYTDLSATVPGVSLITVYPDPVFNKLGDTNQPQMVESKSILTITGERLDSAATLEDYTIMIGDCMSNVSNLKYDSVQASLCPELPIGVSHEVKVYIGALNFSAGEVEIGQSSQPVIDKSSTSGSSSTLDIVIAIVCVLAILMLIVIIVGLVLACRSRSKEKKEIVKDGHLPPLPVESVFGHERLTDRGVGMRPIAFPRPGDDTDILEKSSTNSKNGLMRYPLNEEDEPDISQSWTGMNDIHSEATTREVSPTSAAPTSSSVHTPSVHGFDNQLLGIHEAELGNYGSYQSRNSNSPILSAEHL